MIARAYWHVVVDAGPIVAILDRRDANHAKCREILRQIEPPMLTTWPVVTEVAWILRNQPDSLRQLFASVETGFFRILQIDDSALAEMSQISQGFGALRLQLADLSLMYLTRHLKHTVVFTLDRRDFGVVQRTWKPKLTLLPP